MCYPKPGPRCSPHARANLEKAVASGDHAAIDAARRAYNVTPDGIQELRDAGRDLEADISVNIRQQQFTMLAEAKAKAKAEGVPFTRSTEPTPISALQQRFEESKTDADGGARYRKSRDMILMDRTQVDRLSEEQLSFFVSTLNDVEKLDRARYWKAHPKVLHALATEGDPDFQVKSAVAKQMNVTPATLRTLLKDGNPLVRHAVASNPVLGYNEYAVAASDEDELVREAVASNPNTSPEILDRLVEENPNNAIIARSVRDHENADEETQEKAENVIHSQGLSDVWNYARA